VLVSSRRTTVAEITPDPTRVYIAVVREDLRSGYSEAAADRIREQHIPALLAAVERVLELADDWAKSAADLDAMAERADARGADLMRTNWLIARAQAHQDCAQALQAAVREQLEVRR
jgi:hypothetical protein